MPPRGQLIPADAGTSGKDAFGEPVRIRDRGATARRILEREREMRAPPEGRILPAGPRLVLILSSEENVPCA
jgi:hypothetical protein